MVMKRRFDNINEYVRVMSHCIEIVYQWKFRSVVSLAYIYIEKARIDVEDSG